LSEEGDSLSESTKRTVHRAEFKAKVGLEAVRGAKTINEIGQQYGVHPVVVGQWKKEILDRAGTLFEGKRGPKPAAHADEDHLFGEIAYSAESGRRFRANPATLGAPRRRASVVCPRWPTSVYFG
jgi:transposase-like protein